MLDLLADTPPPEGSVTLPLWVLLSAFTGLCSVAGALWIAYSKSQEARVAYATETNKTRTEDAVATALALKDASEQLRRMSERFDIALRMLEALSKKVGVV